MYTQPVGHGHDLLLPALGGAVHAVGGTELLGQGEAVVVQVDGDDPGRAVQARGHHHR
jgi:hypothetical protein